MSARRPSRLLAVGLVVAAVVATAAPVQAVEPMFPGPRPAARATRVVMLGDSLAHEVSGVVGFFAAPRRIVPKFWGGTAPCDWLGVNLEASRSSVVVVSFTGNRATRCMEDGAGGYLRGAALVDRYRADLTALVRRARASGAQVLLVGQPYRAPSFEADAEVDGINAIYRELAKQRFVSFVDAGAFVELDGRYTPRLPCAPFDAVCDPDGTVVVRGDGVHFCPVEGPSSNCPVWSSGAVRFGMAIASAAMRPGAFE
jgi:hypothetical protein